MTHFDLDLAVVGGGGHVGLPLSIMFAAKGVRTGIYDINQVVNQIINSGRMPFYEPGAERLLEAALSSKLLFASDDPSIISRAKAVIVVIGTPVDEHLNPDPSELPTVLRKYLEHFRDGQLVVLRSTIFPGVTRSVANMFETAGKSVELAFCPERIAEHKAMEELVSLPQIVSAVSSAGEVRAAELFLKLTQKIIAATPEEAELAKLFTNTWRYIKFAAANQFYMMSAANGLDFERIREVIREDYPRAADMPSAGLAAGPCLLKDTMQLAAFSDNTFILGHSAMMVNEGLPLFMVRELEKRFPLSSMTVGVLGMSFKSESDDIRSSLSYKLKNILEFRAGKVLCADPHVNEAVDSRLVELSYVMEKSDVLILATPHPEFRHLETDKPILDVWGVSTNESCFR